MQFPMLAKALLSTTVFVQCIHAAVLEPKALEPKAVQETAIAWKVCGPYADKSCTHNTQYNFCFHLQGRIREHVAAVSTGTLYPKMVCVLFTGKECESDTFVKTVTATGGIAKQVLFKESDAASKAQSIACYA